MAATASRMAIGTSIVRGMPYIAWLPRVNPCAPMITELTMMRRPRVAIEAEAPPSRLIGSPTRNANAAASSTAMAIAGHRPSWLCSRKSGSSGSALSFSAGGMVRVAETWAPIAAKEMWPKLKMPELPV